MTQKLFNMAVDDADAQMLEALASHAGVSMSALVRGLVQARYTEIFGAPLPRGPRPRLGRPPAKRRSKGRK